MLFCSFESIIDFFCFVRETFLKANLFGIDMSKKSKQKVPEASGVIVGCVLLIVTFLMIPLSFKDYLIPTADGGASLNSNADFPHKEFAQVRKHSLV